MTEKYPDYEEHDIPYYCGACMDRGEDKLAVYAHLAQAADDVRLGRVQDADDAYDDIIAELESLDV
jgi:hypothetical protein